MYKLFQQIQNKEQFNALLAEAKKKWGKMQHNAYFLPDFMDAPILQGRLYYLLLPEVLLFSLRQELHSQLYFYAPAVLSQTLSLTGSDSAANDGFSLFSSIDLPPEDAFLPTVASLIGVVAPSVPDISTEALHFPSEQLPARLAGCSRLLTAMGLHRADCYYHMTARTFRSPLQVSDAFAVSTAQPKHIPQLLSLLHKSFSAITSDLPDAAQLMERIAAGEALIVCGTGSDDVVCGYAQLETQGNKYFLRHLVIEPSCRGRQLSKLLFSFIAERIGSASCILWVREDNLAAYRLYAGCGFQFDGKLLINYTNEAPTALSYF